MENITQEEFDKASKLKPKKTKKEVVLTESKFQELLGKMQNPVQAQQELAVQIKCFLDGRMKEDMEMKGYLTDHTRRWVESYNKILERIQHALHGDKSVSLHLHKITHSQIATKMREAMEEDGTGIN